MDPVSLIVAALTAGAAGALKDTTGEAIKDAYAGLKSLLKRKLAGRQLAQEVIDKHETAPADWEKPLRNELAEAGVGEDEEVIREAQKLLTRVDPEGAARGKYNVTISGGQGNVVGDHANVTMTFGNGD